MFIGKCASPFAMASLLTATAVLSGCFEPGAPASGPGGTGSGSAATAAQTWSGVCDGCGHRVAFMSVTNPANHSGWSLDFSRLPRPVEGYALRRLTPSSGNPVFTEAPGLTDIDLRGNNELWGVSEGGWVFKNSFPFDGNNPWIRLSPPIAATRIATGTASGKVWILVAQPSLGGSALYYLNESNNTWARVNAGLIAIDVDNNGDLWGIGGDRLVYRLPGGNPSGSWERLTITPNAIDIACGGGKVYIMTSATANGGNRLKQWNGDLFEDIPGGVVDIMVDVGGRLWAANAAGNVFYYTP